jgi:hypothetical protein
MSFGSEPNANAAGGAAGTTGSIYGSMVDASMSNGANAANTGGTLGVSGAGNYGASGYGIDPINGANTGIGPTQNMADYGTQDPSLFKKASGMLDRIQEGSKQNFPQFLSNFGNNAKTYGYVLDRAGAIASLAAADAEKNKAMSGFAIQPQISYVEPRNEYLDEVEAKKRAKRLKFY